MNSAVVAAFAAILTVASAGHLAAPVLGYHSQVSSAAGYGISHSTGIVRGAPLIGAYGAHGAYGAYPAHVRLARGLIAGHVAHAPLAYAAAPIAHAAPLAYSAPIAHAAPLAIAAPGYATRSYHVNPLTYGGAAHIRLARGLIAGHVAHAPLATYAAAPLAYSAPVAHAAPLAYSAPIAHAAPLAIAAPGLATRSYHVNPLTYGGAAHIRLARGLIAGHVAHAPLTTYAAAPIAHSAIAYGAPLAHAAPLAYGAHVAPAYSGVPAIHGLHGLHGAHHAGSLLL